MKKINVRFTDEHIEIFKKLINDDQARSNQELIIKLIDFTLRRKYGIDEVKSWYRYKKEDVYEYPYISRKNRKRAKSGALEQTKPIVKQEENKQDDIDISTRERIKQSQSKRPVETDPEIFETWEELEETLKTLTNRGKWQEANRIAEKNDYEFEEQLEPFFIAYNER
jgi:hypothetical protein